MTDDALWLAAVRRPGSDRLVDVKIGDGRVRAIVDHEPHRNDGASVHDAEGRWLIPGLYDGHVHATQYAIQQGRIDVSAATSAEHATRLVRDVLDHQPSRRVDGEPVIAAGFRDGFWPEQPTKTLLDDEFGSLPVIMISGDLHCGWANSAGMTLLGHRDHPTGVLKEKVWMDGLAALPQPPADRTDAWVDTALRGAVARGLTGIRDFEFADNLTVWLRRRRAGGVAIRVDCGVMAATLSERTTRGLRTGESLSGTDGLITMGPVNVFVDGSLNTRTALCHDPYPGGDDHGELVLDRDELTAIMADARGRGLQIAVHAIGDRANTIALDCFAASGIAGRIEHAQLVADDDLGRFAALGVVASVQPWHAIDDWPVADRYWSGRTGRSFPYAALAEAGATIEFGSDAPVAPLDPWHAIAAAVDRHGVIGREWHREQQLPVADAVRFSTCGPGIVRAGDAADLVLLDSDPYTLTGPELITIGVHATAVAGRRRYGPSELTEQGLDRSAGRRRRSVADDQ
ncbi:amidohydrolase family protein [Microlunatus elymi]|uniref:Amidohydrolase family protein n=1 Tax=Microlunatus elymi TaxID=2596828 RepID=A0A516Q630_9ACTN|nr:amidohydrolase family protein [Microlunatus elymi]QDP98883.1 amidohydrolase family protein [Microlunatus elymi]